MNNEPNPTTPIDVFHTEAIDATPKMLLLTNGEHCAQPVTESNADPATTVASTDESSTNAIEMPGGMSPDQHVAGMEASPVAADMNASDSDAVNTAEVALIVEASAPTATRRKRGTDPSRNNIWPRLHVFCMWALVAKLLSGAGGDFKRAVAMTVLELCRWILKPGYLNLDDSWGVKQGGLSEYYLEWAKNRIYFFTYGERGEHPSTRRNLRTVHDEFCRQFSQNVDSRIPISEAQARAFWLSVSDRVPFQSPVPFEDKEDANTAWIGCEVLAAAMKPFTKLYNLHVFETSDSNEPAEEFTALLLVQVAALSQLKIDLMDCKGEQSAATYRIPYDLQASARSMFDTAREVADLLRAGVHLKIVSPDANSTCDENANGQAAALAPVVNSQEVQAPITSEEVCHD